MPLEAGWKTSRDPPGRRQQNVAATPLGRAGWPDGKCCGFSHPMFRVDDGQRAVMRNETWIVGDDRGTRGLLDGRWGAFLGRAIGPSGAVGPRPGKVAKRRRGAPISARALDDRDGGPSSLAPLGETPSFTIFDWPQELPKGVNLSSILSDPNPLPSRLPMGKAPLPVDVFLLTSSSLDSFSASYQTLVGRSFQASCHATQQKEKRTLSPCQRTMALPVPAGITLP